MKCDGQEGLQVIQVFYVLKDIEELVTRSTEESQRLLSVGRHGEVDFRPKARGTEQCVPP